MKIDPILTSFNLWCLSHAQLSEYLSYLGERGLIEALPTQIKVSSSVEKHIYKITEEGCRLLQISQEIEGLVGLD
jgi:predicted transcriptional regulator